MTRKFVLDIITISLLSTLLSCTEASPFSNSEKNLINSAPPKTPFRVLQLNNMEDSIILRKECSDIQFMENNKDIELLISRLEATLEVEQGVGLAAPQVGISRNIILFKRIDMEGHPVEVAINPRITQTADSLVCFTGDGCLSIPDVRGNSKRYPWIEVEYTNRQGVKVKEKLEGYNRLGDFTGVIFQHEFDHLQGVLFIDKLCEPEILIN